MKRFLYFLIAALGFGSVSCEESGFRGGNLDAYGVLHVDFHITTRVVDEEGTPIKGIEVSTGSSTGDFTPVSHTDENGLYTLTMKVWPTVEVLRFTDIDGKANGGEFMDKSVNLMKVIQENDSDDGVISIDVTLKKRE
ncbi:MAG: radical SAM-associated putative lipoprotein [Alistipes sp.]|nr:radical SAM-associated putative lipoprotein [Alistipes sp.]